MADAATQIAPGTNGRIPIADATDELGRMGAGFNALLDRLDGALEQQRRFLADAAHELRTPLARVRSRVELAMLPLPAQGGGPIDAAPSGPGEPAATVPEPAASTALPAIHDELVRMSQLVDELLQLARADAGVDAGLEAMVPVFLDDLVTDELHRWHVDAERAHITLGCSALQEAPIVGDTVLLRRLIGILLDNALRYGHAGGHVDVRVEADAASVVLHVEDDGIGIAPDEQSRVAERFYRGARARARRSDGSGLGLAIASWIVHRHDGTMAFSAGAHGAGTLVSVRMPLASVLTKPATPVSA